MLRIRPTVQYFDNERAHLTFNMPYCYRCIAYTLNVRIDKVGIGGKKKTLDWREGSVIKGTNCSPKGRGLKSQHPHGS